MASLRILTALLALSIAFTHARHGDTCQLTYQSCRHFALTNYTSCEIGVLESLATYLQQDCRPILFDREECRTDTRVSPSWYDLLLNDVVTHIDTICSVVITTSQPPAVLDHCLSGFGTVLTPVGDCSSFDISVGDVPPENPQPHRTCSPPLKFDTRPGICVCNWTTDPGYECRAVTSSAITHQGGTEPAVTNPIDDGAIGAHGRAGGSDIVQPAANVHVRGEPIARSCYTGDIPVYLLTPTNECRSFDQTLGTTIPTNPEAVHDCRPNTKFDLRWCSCNHEALVGSGCFSQP